MSAAGAAGRLGGRAADRAPPRVPALALTTCRLIEAWCSGPWTASPRLRLTEIEPLLADRQVTLFDDLRHDVDAALDLKRHQVGCVVAEFIERGEFGRAGADVRERPVVVDGGHEEWLFVGPEPIRESQLRRIRG